MKMHHCESSASAVPAPHNQSAEMMEQFWKSILPVDQNSCTKPPSSKSIDTGTAPPTVNNSHLHTVDDEMAAWLHYPSEEFFAELPHPNPNPNPNPNPASAALPPTAVGRPAEDRATRSHNFPIFSRMVEPLERWRSGFTVVDSNDTPISNTTGPNEVALAAGVTTSTTAAVAPAGEERVEVGDEGISSPSSGEGTATTTTGTGTTTGETASESRKKKEVVCGKRKVEELGESLPTATATATARAATLPPREDLDSDDEKKHSRGSGSTANKRTRSADVHNQSKRRRRDRINERMKALQELIPRCNKSDKASMLDEAIEYMKQLQTQIQIMSMGYAMLYPAMQQQYMPQMPVMGMGVDMGTSRPVMPYPPAVPAPPPAIPSPGANLVLPVAPTFPIPPFPMPCVQPSTHQADSTGNQYALKIPATTQITNMADPYQQYLAYQQLQMQAAVQSSTINQPVLSKPGQQKSEGDNDEDAHSIKEALPSSE